MLADVLVLSFTVSVVFVVVVVGSYLFAKDIHLAEISRKTQRASLRARHILWLALILATIVGGSLLTAGYLTLSHDAGFWELFLAAYAVQVAINLADFLIVDIAIYRWWYPTWMRFEGFEPLWDVGYHLKACFRGLIIVGAPIALLSALVFVPFSP